MELWIRSQNKKVLEKTNNFTITKVDDEEYHIINNTFTIMGKYKTLERALEVLDEIQQKLSMKLLTIPAHNCNFDKYNSVSCIDTQMNIIYEMPKE